MWWRRPPGIPGSAKPSQAKPCIIFRAARAPTRPWPPQNSAHRRALIGRLGTDAFGQQLRQFLSQQGVDLALVKDTADDPYRDRRDHHRRRRQHHRRRARRQRAGQCRGCRRPRAGQRRRRRQPVRNSAGYDRRLLQTGARGRGDHHPQSGAGDRLRAGVARSRRYPDPQRDRARASRAGTNFPIPTSLPVSSKPRDACRPRQTRSSASRWASAACSRWSAASPR